jgi:hypothetical protein
MDVVLGSKINGTKHILCMLNSSILETQVDGHDIMYFSGKYIGEGMVRRYVKLHGDANIINVLRHVLGRLGLAEVSGIKVVNNRVMLDINDCVLCDGRKRECGFLLGIIAGMAGEISGCSYCGEPVRCSSGACTLAIRKK